MTDNGPADIRDYGRAEQADKQTQKEHDKGAGGLAGKRGVVKIAPGFRIELVHRLSLFWPCLLVGLQVEIVRENDLDPGPFADLDGWILIQEFGKHLLRA